MSSSKVRAKAQVGEQEFSGREDGSRLADNMANHH